MISFWEGSLDLTPASDNWLDTRRLEANIINVEGNFAETVAEFTREFGGNPQEGFGATVWNGWQTVWTGRQTQQRFDQLVNWGPMVARRRREQTRRRWTTVTTERQQRRTGTRTSIVEQFDQTSQGDRLVSRDLIGFMRSRNVQFVAKRVKPSTRLYAFFDG